MDSQCDAEKLFSICATYDFSSAYQVAYAPSLGLIMKALIFFLMTVGVAHSQILEDDWIYSVAYIQNESTGKAGTGFFVAREIGSNQHKIFLVSNAHVLSPRPLGANDTNKLALAKAVVSREQNGDLTTAVLDLTLRDAQGTASVTTHPSPEVDVAVMDVAEQVIDQFKIRKELKVGIIHENRFATKEMIDKLHVTIGQQVLMLGFPLNLVEGKTAVAVARSGVIATSPARDFRGNPVFLVDSSTIRGSSGSPVFVPLRPFKIDRDENGRKSVNHKGGYTPCLIGIVAKTVPDWELLVKRTDTFGLPPSEISVVTTANLGIVFRTDAISETLDATGNKKRQNASQGQFEY
jgi:hypothetical protein